MKKTWGLSLISLGMLLLTFAFFWFLWAGKDLIDYDDAQSVQSLSFNQNFSEVEQYHHSRRIGGYHHGDHGSANPNNRQHYRTSSSNSCHS
jgi:hypothetical protein